MANPNIVNVSLIRGKTAVKQFVKRYTQFLLRNVTNSNEVLKVNSIIATNRNNVDENISLQYVSTLGSFNIISGMNIPPKTTVNLMQKETSIYLEENTSLNVFSQSSNDNIGIICSYEQIASSIVSDRNDNYGGDAAEPAPIIGQQSYIVAGTYSWVVPANVTSVSVVCVGGGGGGAVGDGSNYGSGGAGGGLSYGNSISVTPGESMTVIVGAGGNPITTSVRTDGNSGQASQFNRGATVLLNAGGGQGGIYAAVATGGTSTGTSRTGGGVGGGGGRGYWTAGGGGAAGYTGNGGDGGNTSSGGSGAVGGNGIGGGGGGAGTGNGGGGVGILGQGSSGVGSSGAGGGGSGGTSGSGATAGSYGGGGGGVATSGTTGAGGVGAVRIIWGTGRAFPSTLTGNL